ncbi:MAG: hypothetical protein Q8939_08830 [Bacteroidota bacterium]|nr:hypothetical protein [Bacteroidota bacterium]MDP4212545.1 hypothetical protein [Bacteroidota bacterium]
METRLNPGDHLKVLWEISTLKEDRLSKHKFVCIGYEIDGRQ